MFDKFSDAIFSGNYYGHKVEWCGPSTLIIKGSYLKSVSFLFSVMKYRLDIQAVAPIFGEIGIQQHFRPRVIVHNHPGNGGGLADGFPVLDRNSGALYLEGDPVSLMPGGIAPAEHLGDVLLVRIILRKAL